jgi:hypothetical protein
MGLRKGYNLEVIEWELFTAGAGSMGNKKHLCDICIGDFEKWIKDA